MTVSLSPILPIGWHVSVSSSTLISFSCWLWLPHPAISSERLTRLAHKVLHSLSSAPLTPWSPGTHAIWQRRVFIPAPLFPFPSLEGNAACPSTFKIQSRFAFPNHLEPEADSLRLECFKWLTVQGMFIKWAQIHFLFFLVASQLL